MKKGDRMILDHKAVVRITSARGSMVEAKYDEPPYKPVGEKIVRSRLTPTMRRATDMEIVSGAELWTPHVSTGGWMKMKVSNIFSGSTVLCRDMLRNQNYNMRPQDLYVDEAALLRSK